MNVFVPYWVYVIGWVIHWVVVLLLLAGLAMLAWAFVSYAYLVCWDWWGRVTRNRRFLVRFLLEHGDWKGMWKSMDDQIAVRDRLVKRLEGELGDVEAERDKIARDLMNNLLSDVSEKEFACGWYMGIVEHTKKVLDLEPQSLGTIGEQIRQLSEIVGWPEEDGSWEEQA